MSVQSIWNALRGAGLSPAGAAGLMGNMNAESAMRANNAQDGMTSLSDMDYTAGVDNGTYIRFVTDAVGYGLCQWTFHTRKAALLAFAREHGASIGDEDMQVRFCIKELQSDFPALWTHLCETSSVWESASRVCTEYERPAVNNIDARASAAQRFYDTLQAGETLSEPAETRTAAAKWTADMAVLCEGFGGTQVLALQKLLACDGYTVELSGLFDFDTAAAVTQYQRNTGLTPDGIVGAKTWKKLFEV